MDKATGASFVDTVRAFALKELTGAHATKGSPHCLVVFAAANGELTVSIGTESVSHPLPS